MNSYKAAFLDRDGVINRKAPEGKYVTRWEEMVILPGVALAILTLRRAGFRIIVISNQRCVAKGLLTADDLDVLHRRMCETLAAEGAIIDAAYYCPHETHTQCTCRKPAPGLLLEAAENHHIDLKASWMIGDSPSDIEAGRGAGCKTALLQDGDGTPGVPADMVATSLLEAARQILKLHEAQLPCPSVAIS
jgi:D-glycero-D-manno-heptose 1,7-bisphosphate phosphatase